MRSFIPDYDLRTPRDLKTALKWLDEETLTPIAGGTDLMVLLESGHLRPGNFLNLWGLKELQGIEEDGSTLTLGALTTYSQVQNHPTARRLLPMLVEAARLTGATAIQNRGTLGGNIINASPAADSLPPLLCYDARVELANHRASRWVEYGSFHQGYKKMDRDPKELLTRIQIPLPDPKALQFYRKVGTRDYQAISKVCLAAMASADNGVYRKIRIAFGSVAATPVRCPKTEGLLEGNPLSDALKAKALDTLRTEIKPIDDIRSNSRFRLRVAQNILKEFLDTL